MDKNFLEFWGNMMLTAAKGQKQMDEMSRWTKKGQSEMKEMNEMFSKFYGVNPSNTEKQDISDGFLSMQKNAFSQFSSSFEEYLKLLDVIPRKKYMELVKKHESLKKQIKGQEETFGHFQMMMKCAGDGNDNAVKKLNNVISLQVSQFEKLMDEFSNMGTVGRHQKKTASKPKVVKKTNPAAKTRPVK